jgi:hypothetical protein
MVLIDDDGEAYDVADEDCEFDEGGCWCCFDEDETDCYFEFEPEAE